MTRISRENEKSNSSSVTRVISLFMARRSFDALLGKLYDLQARLGRQQERFEKIVSIELMNGIQQARSVWVWENQWLFPSRSCNAYCSWHRIRADNLRRDKPKVFMVYNYSGAEPLARKLRFMPMNLSQNMIINP